MHKAIQVLVIAVVAGGLSILGMGCQSSQKTNAEHPNAEHPNGEHPQSEHPEGEHPDG